MTSLFARLCTSVGLLAILTACVDREITNPKIKETEPMGFPVPAEETYVPVEEPVFGSALEPLEVLNESSLLSFDPSDPSAVPEVVLQTAGGDAGKTLAIGLDTDNDGTGSAEYTVMVRNDDVFVVDHADGSYRKLYHLANMVCEIKPKVVVTTTTVGNDVEHRVHHARSVYVKTKSNSISGSDCTSSGGVRYVELPLNYNGFARDGDPRYSNRLYIIDESEYNAELVFGWVDDELTSTSTTDKRLAYGFLGYNSVTRRLEFFSGARNKIWSQPRKTELFTVNTTERQAWFKVSPLEHQQYLVELGRDTFVVDAGSMFFNRAATDVPQILSDRIYQRDSRSDGRLNTDYHTVHNSADLILVDNFKIFRHRYAPASVPETTRTFNIFPLPSVGHGRERYEQTYAFNQLQLRSCELSMLFPDRATCRQANFHQTTDPNNWQFATTCQSALGCAITVDNSDYCTTQAEFLVSQDSSNLCKTEEYQHLNELNNPANDAEFRGFIQYGPRYVRDLDLKMDAQSLFVTLRLNERDVLVRYFYNVELNAPKLSRERVLLGRRVAHAGLDTHLMSNGNLFLTTLTNLSDQHRTDACYNTELNSETPCVSCSAEQFAEGKCLSRYNIYESRALFCSATQVSAGECVDSRIIPTDLLSVQNAGTSGRWLPVHDQSSADGVGVKKMYLLQSAQWLDEARLENPRIFAVDNDTGIVDFSDHLGQITGTVEFVSSAWRQGSGFDRLNLVEYELDTGLGKSSAHGVAAIHFVLQSDVPQSLVQKAAQKAYLRRK